MCNFEQLVIAVFLQIFLAADVDPFDISPLIIFKFRHLYNLCFKESCYRNIVLFTSQNRLILQLRELFKSKSWDIPYRYTLYIPYIYTLPYNYLTCYLTLPVTLPYLTLILGWKSAHTQPPHT